MTAQMTPEAKSLLSKTIRSLRARLLDDLDNSLHSTYRLGIPADKAKLELAQATRRARLESWIDEQPRALPSKEAAAAKKANRFRAEVVKEASHTLLNRLVYLRLLEGAGLRKTKVLTGGWRSPGYRDFRDLAPELLGDETEGYALLLQVVFDELALDLPGLYGRDGLADFVPVPADTLRYVVEQLDQAELDSCWTDDMTLGWAYQYWNDPEREALDAKLNDGGKVESHEIASKTQMFTERYMVDWLLQNSLGPMWLAMCKNHGWTPLAEQHGTLERLEQRRIAWRAKREAGEVELTELMPLDSDEERRWAYYVPQPIPDDAVTHAPKSVRELKLLDPAVGSGHFLVVAFDLLIALYREEAQHRQESWSDREIVESILSNNLHGVDLDPRAVQIAAAALWLKARSVAPDAAPASLNLVASKLRLAGLADDDPALVQLREAVRSETGIPAGLTDSVVHALKGADSLGSLLKVGDALQQAIDDHHKARAEVQGDLLAKDRLAGAQVQVEFVEGDAKARLEKQLEGFLAAHTGSADLGLRLRGEQLATGVRFLRILREGAYDLVVGNPPYQGTSKMVDAGYVRKMYPLGKADLYAAFLQRGLELVREGGTSALLTMRNWMFIKQYSGLRKWLLENFDLRALGDLAVGAFDEVPNDILSVVIGVFRAAPQNDTMSIAAQPTPPQDASYDRARTQRKRAATLCQVGRYEFDPAALEIVPEWPLVYWWETRFLLWYGQLDKLGVRGETRRGPECVARRRGQGTKPPLYRDTARLSDTGIGVEGRALGRDGFHHELLGACCDVRQGMATAADPRFLRRPWEIALEPLAPFSADSSFKWTVDRKWSPFVKGAAGTVWMEPCQDLISWHCNGLECKVFASSTAGKNSQYYFKAGIAFSMIGASFGARAHRHPSIFGHKGSSVYPMNVAGVLCVMNSSRSRAVLQALNPGIGFEVGDVRRLPLFSIDHSEKIYHRLDSAFTTHESHREPSVEFLAPGPSPWAHAQAWAQLAVDRPENTPLPEYTEHLTPEPPSDHLSYALGVALGRFGAPSLTQKQGILDPETDDLAHALPDGTLFLDGTLPPDFRADSLGHPAAALLHQAWASYAPALDSKRGNLRDWLRLDFFDLHKSMYENRPIHWPLSSERKTFVAWINIHRWHAGTLRNLLINHLNPTKTRLEGQIQDLQATRDSGDAKASRQAEKRLNEAKRHLKELLEFIASVGQCAEKGPPQPDAKTPDREQDAPYDPDLDDGVMINASALWPLLERQWRDPKKWWKELVLAKGRKDYDWSHLAAKYFPTRVDEKCRKDPSLAVAHGCFWKYHPERAYAWELRLQDELDPDFTIDEDWGEPYEGVRNSEEAHDKFTSERPDEAEAIYNKEHKRRERKRTKEQDGLFESDDESAGHSDAD